MGIGVVLDAIPPLNKLRELLNHHIKNDATLSKRLENAKLIGGISGWPLTIYDSELPIVDDRVMLVGDAAGLINPLNGEGIQYALLSGRWASKVAASCISKSSCSKQDLSEYAKVVERELGYDMSLSSLIVQLIRNRSLNPIWLNTLEIVSARANVDPKYADTVGGIMMGSIPSSEATNLDIVIGTIEQACLSEGLKASQDPTYLTRKALDAARIGFEIAGQTLQNPHEFINWAIDSAVAAAENAAASFTRNSNEMGKTATKSFRRPRRPN